jgi:hypothetical protein
MKRVSISYRWCNAEGTLAGATQRTAADVALATPLERLAPAIVVDNLQYGHTLFEFREIYLAAWYNRHAVLLLKVLVFHKHTHEKKFKN